MKIDNFPASNLTRLHSIYALLGFFSFLDPPIWTFILDFSLSFLYFFLLVTLIVAGLLPEECVRIVSASTALIPMAVFSTSIDTVEVDLVAAPKLRCYFRTTQGSALPPALLWLTVFFKLYPTTESSPVVAFFTIVGLE